MFLLFLRKTNFSTQHAPKASAEKTMSVLRDSDETSNRLARAREECARARTTKKDRKTEEAPSKPFNDDENRQNPQYINFMKTITGIAK